VVLVGAETELTYGAEHSPDAAEYFYKGPKDVERLWDTTPTIVLVIDRSVFGSIQPILGPYEIVAQDDKKLALAHFGTFPAPPSPTPLANSAAHD
jgi:hypothetical protein